MRPCGGGLRLALAGLLAMGAMAAPAGAAVDVYPPGGGEFNGGAEGWEVTGAACNVPLLCSASGGFDGGEGNSAGSLGADTNIGLNLVSLFSSTVTLQSPDFTVAADGPAIVHLERRFSPGSLVDLAPRLDYSAQLLDRTSGRRAGSISEVIYGSSDWAGRDGAATVRPGHTYAILIRAETASSLIGTGLLAGGTSVRFDNVFLEVHSPGGAADGSGSGGGAAGESTRSTITRARLAALAPATLAGPAKLKGRRLFVKARCPKKVGSACRISVLGLLKKRRPATTGRQVKVAAGKTKRLVLRVKSRARGKLVVRKRLLFKVGVRAGKANAVAYKRLKLVRG